MHLSAFRGAPRGLSAPPAVLARARPVAARSRQAPPRHNLSGAPDSGCRSRWQEFPLRAAGPSIGPLPSGRARIAARASSLDSAAAAAADGETEKLTNSSIFKTHEEDDDASEEDPCGVYIDRDGAMLEVMCCDYGLKSGVERMYDETDGAIPGSGFSLAIKHFKRELANLRRSFREDEYAVFAKRAPAKGPVGKFGHLLGGVVVRTFAAFDVLLEAVRLLPTLDPAPAERTPEKNSQACAELHSKLEQLTLSNDAVWERERAREAAGGAVEAPWFVRGVYLSLCGLLDVLFDNRPMSRFWFLETVARMPYFSYISVLHLYESLGWWRAAAELRKIHFAEEWNELHHLQIMEALGGDRLWFDRFVAYHAAVVYYWILVALFIGSPTLAYGFSELIEAHAVDTYGEFADANEALLKSLPPPLVAALYYRSNDLYMFDEFQTASRPTPRNPPTNNLYDVFINIRDDEGEHVKTMAACQDSTVMDQLVERREGGSRRV